MNILGRLVYNIGANLCLEFNVAQRVQVLLRCSPNEFFVTPHPVRTWVKDGQLIYSRTDSSSAAVNESFYAVRNNSLFLPQVVDPPPFDAVSFPGGIFLDTEASNLSMPFLAPPGVTTDNVARAVFNSLLGDYMCSQSNVYGTDSARTTISECRELLYHTY
jgi:hypothetical protein